MARSHRTLAEASNSLEGPSLLVVAVQSSTPAVDVANDNALLMAHLPPRLVVCRRVGMHDGDVRVEADMAVESVSAIRIEVLVLRFQIAHMARGALGRSLPVRMQE